MQDTPPCSSSTPWCSYTDQTFPSKTVFVLFTLCTVYIIIRAKILIHVWGSADHPQSRLWLNWGGLTVNAARWSNRLIQIWSQTRFSSNTVKFETNLKTPSTWSKCLSQTIWLKHLDRVGAALVQLDLSRFTIELYSRWIID